MDYLIEIPAGTLLSAFDCIVTWNQLKESSAVARARLSANTPPLFDRAAVTGTRFVLGKVAAGVTPEALHVLIRLVLQHRGIDRGTTLRTRAQADGSVLLEIAFSGTDAASDPHLQ